MAADSSDKQLDSICGRKLGDFVLGLPIGKGSYGVVYRATQFSLRRPVVVKVLHKRRRTDADALQRFEEEARMAARLDHPNAARVHALGIEPDGLLWFAMEYVDGVTLSTWLEQHGPMSLDQFAPFFEQLAEVVDAAHERGIVHRDLKPSNIMVTESTGGQLAPKLLDFGIAKLLGEAEQLVAIDASEDLDEPDPEATAAIRKVSTPRRRQARSPTASGGAPGTPPYMAPEQWRAPSTVGPPADVYALGVIAYEALTGVRPFRAAKAEEFAAQHLESPIPLVGPGLPADLDAIFSRALAKRPKDRFANATEMAEAFRAVRGARMTARLRVAARQWDGGGRPAELLWSGRVLAELEQWMERRSASTSVLTSLDHAFIDASRERAMRELLEQERRAKFRRRVAGVVAVTGLVAGLQLWSYLQTQKAQHAVEIAQQREHDAQQLANATAIAGAVETGRAALLHDELEAARQHLANAWQRGDRSSATAFMLARAIQPQLAELAKFSSISRRAWSVAWSPDGNQIATADDGGVQIWDARSYQRLFQMPSSSVYSAAYNPDSTRLVTAGLDGVHVWDPATGSLVRELRRSGDRLRFHLAAVSPDGSLVAVVDGTGATTDVWRADTGAQVAELHNDAAGAPSLTFSADGRCLATSSGNRVQIVDTTTWRATALPLRQVLSLSMDPTGSRIAVATAGGGASVWTLSGSLALQLRDGGEPTDKIVWSPDGRLIAAASRSGSVLIWDARRGTLLSRSNHLHDRVASIEFDPTSKLVLAAGRRVIVSDAAQGIALVSLEGPQAVAHFAPSGPQIIGVSTDGMARVWDSNSPYRRWGSPPIADSCGLFAGAEPDQRYLPIACPGHPTRVWDTARNQLLAELPSVSTPGGDFALTLPVVSADGTRAAIARGNVAEVYGLPGGHLVRAITHGAAVSALAFGASGELVSGDVAGALLVTRDGGPQALLSAHGGIDAVTVLENGQVAAADAAKRLRVLERERVVIDLQLSERVGLLRPSPNKHRLLLLPSSTIPSRIGAIDPAQLWDLETGQHVASLVGHVGRTVSMRWTSADEILTAGSDGTARSWDAATGRQRVLYRGHALFLADAARSGDVVVGGDGDGMLHFWDAASGAELWTLQGHRPYVAGVRIEGSDLVTRDYGGGVSRWSIPPAMKVLEDAVRRGIVVP